jgi:hypothetical protein
MMDLDTLRSGLRAAPERPLAAVDIDQVMVRGRRLRLRRRLVAGGGTGVLAAAVLAVSAGAGWFTPPAPRPDPIGQAPPANSVAPSPGTLGDVVRTGIRPAGAEVVLYAVAISEPSLPGIHFGVLAGQRDAAGRITGLVESNEVTGSDRSPGFHAVQAPTETSGVRVPEFGYYVGPAVRITGSVGGRPVEAKQAVWSEDATVVLFWFDPADAPAGSEPSGLTAWDAAGQALPAGNASAGHG